MDNNNNRQTLATLIEKNAVIRGNFVLSSGNKADHYIDLRKVTLNHVAAPLVGSVMLDLILHKNPIPIFSVGGLTMGADPVATAIMYSSALSGHNINSFVVRKNTKTYGMQKNIEGPDIKGKNVFIVEDTSTTGNSVLQAVNSAKEHGANVLGVAVIVDRNTGAREKVSATGLPYLSAFTWNGSKIIF